MSLSNYRRNRLGLHLAAKRIKTLEKENARLIAVAATESQRVEKRLRDVSHDLRNALASVLTGSEVLLSINNSPDTRPLLESIHRQANVFARIVDRLTEDHKEPHDERATTLKATQEQMPVRILAIDDRRDVLLPLRSLLTKDGHEFAEAEDGSSGLEKVETFRPEIVLCDIDLQGNLSGLDVARKIRSQSGSNSIYLVAISGNFQAHDLEKSADAGFDFHIAKPITAVALRNLIYNRPKNLRSQNREIPAVSAKQS